MRTAPSLIIFAGMLLLAGCTQAPTTESGDALQMPITSGDDAPQGSIHNLPVPDGVQAARTALAAKLNVEPTKILILEAHEKDWSDSCLGLGGPAESCLAAVTPGYDVLMTYQGVEYRYRTDAEGTTVRAE
jgi:hypothetical protein